VGRAGDLSRHMGEELSSLKSPNDNPILEIFARSYNVPNRNISSGRSDENSVAQSLWAIRI
jgi:hypothetical protein